MHKFTFLLILAILTLSCSSSKITTSQWVSNEFKNQDIDRILIFANTEDSDLQKEFENRTAALLSKEGISPVTMHELFPTIEYKEVRSQEEINQFVSECKDKNIDKILFASQKSVIVDTVKTKSLHNYMNSLEPLKIGYTPKEKLEYKTKEITTYIIEAAVYDIDATTVNKPIATTTLKATNPKSTTVLKERLLKAIVTLFESK